MHNTSDSLVTVGSWSELTGLSFDMPIEFYDGRTVAPGTVIPLLLCVDLVLPNAHAILSTEPTYAPIYHHDASLDQ
jgi:hypothetical protein